MDSCSTLDAGTRQALLSTAFEGFHLRMTNCPSGPVLQREHLSLSATAILAISPLTSGSDNPSLTCKPSERKINWSPQTRVLCDQSHHSSITAQLCVACRCPAWLAALGHACPRVPRTGVNQQRQPQPDPAHQRCRRPDAPCQSSMQSWYVTGTCGATSKLRTLQRYLNAQASLSAGLPECVREGRHHMRRPQHSGRSACADDCQPPWEGVHSQKASSSGLSAALLCLYSI